MIIHKIDDERIDRNNAMTQMREGKKIHHHCMNLKIYT